MGILPFMEMAMKQEGCRDIDIPEPSDGDRVGVRSITSFPNLCVRVYFCQGWDC